ncbi:MAG: cytochrome b [Ferrovum sp.]|nr:cytochrome b [Ferrovum sp.]
MALFMTVLLVAIEVKGGLPKGVAKTLLTEIHKQLGVLVFLLCWGRIFWRFTRRLPPITPALGRLQTGISHVSHLLLYVVMLVMPALGVLFQQARGNSVNFLGWTLPWIMNDDSGMQYAKTLKDLHETLGNMFIWLIVLHGAAALYHHWIRRDDTLKRMLGSWVR